MWSYFQNHTGTHIMRCSKVFPGLFALWNFIWEQGLNLAIFHLLLPILGKSYPYIKQTSPVLTMTVLHNFGNKSTKEIVFCLLNSAWTRVMCYAHCFRSVGKSERPRLGKWNVSCISLIGNWKINVNDLSIYLSL